MVRTNLATAWYILTEYCLLQMNPYSPCSWFIDGDFYSMVIYLLSFAIY